MGGLDHACMDGLLERLDYRCLKIELHFQLINSSLEMRKLEFKMIRRGRSFSKGLTFDVNLLS